MKTPSGPRALLVSAFLALFIPHSPAADSAATGIVQGAVSNAATGLYLDGAQVTLSPGEVTVLTSHDGHFVFPPVAAGEHRLTVS